MSFKEKIAAIGAQLGLLPAMIADLEAAAQRIIDSIALVDLKRKELEEAVKAKNQCRVDDVQIICDAAIVMKRHADYKDALGGALGINGYTQLFDPKELQPVIRLKAHTGLVEVSFNLQIMNSISIYSRIKGTLGWEKLGNDYESPFEDRRPLAVPNQPELREYMCRYFNGREDVGQPSDIIPIVFGG